MVPTLLPAPARNTRDLQMAAGERCEALAGAPAAPLGPVGAAAPEGVGGPGGAHVGALFVAEGHLVDQVERPDGGT
jgi:hypothetical protein